MKLLKSNMLLAVTALAVVMLAFAGTASAATISIDPGNVGDTFTEREVAFGDLNGTALGGQQLLLDFVFTDLKYLQVEGTQTIVKVVLITDVLTATNLPPALDGYLSDIDGASIHTADFTSSTLVAGPTIQVDYILDFGPIPTSTQYYDVHFTLNMPTLAGTVTGGSVFLSNGKDAEPLEVGQVPEPATMTLLALGGLALLRRKRVGR
jgi:hypothetical protein